MKNGDIKLNADSLTAAVGTLGKKVRTYRGFILFLLVATLYGFILWRINVYSNAPAATSNSTQSAARPHIDPATVSKLLSLQDNSVSVQALFDQARQNPFQE